jgi:hypothetical protein
MFSCLLRSVIGESVQQADILSLLGVGLSGSDNLRAPTHSNRRRAVYQCNSPSVGIQESRV